MKLIQLREKDFKKENIPFHPRTVYRWRVQGKYPEMFAVIGGRTLLDVDKFYQIAMSSNKKEVKK